MDLTGKCKKDFEKWYNEEYFFGVELAFIEIDSLTKLSMQFGVYVDFFDSVGINITLYQLDFQTWFGYSISHFEKLIKHERGIWRRNQARTESIIKANEIYNSRQ
ncbi:hypothetical protein [Aestuariibaculum marinum]|uniref:Uncharacterized protein n=1 Tax=Aestuariibaculum marinum TaxID=2683592 RepID=A0A8J6PWY8_9FLAO|nr:hypothetical protein [Aestuariibaculum marinum]MBD0822630.1 hypothetical protein [Aestuariibaculum marinum]